MSSPRPWQQRPRPHLTLHRDHIAPKPTVTQPLRLLCADDEEDIRTILEMALALDPEIEATIVTDGTEVLQRATEGRWDAFLLDGMMPGIDGYDVCRRLKEDPSTSALPVAFLTARARRDEINRALSCGAVACLPKPFDPLTLAAEVRRAIRR